MSRGKREGEAPPAPEPLAVAHAFAVSTVNMAMAAGRDLAIDGPLTPGLIENLAEYQRVWAAWMPDTFRAVAVRPSSLPSPVTSAPSSARLRSPCSSTQSSRIRST